MEGDGLQGCVASKTGGEKGEGAMTMDPFGVWKLWILLGEPMWKPVWRLFLCVIKAPVRVCCPQADTNGCISHAAVSNKPLHHPVYKKIKKNWLVPLKHCWQECRMAQPLWKTVQWVLKNVNINLPCDPGILLPGISPREMKTYVHTQTSMRMLTAALFTTAQKAETPQVSINQWISK